MCNQLFSKSFYPLIFEDIDGTISFFIKTGMVGALVGLSISKTLQRLAYQALFELQAICEPAIYSGFSSSR